MTSHYGSYPYEHTRKRMLVNISSNAISLQTGASELCSELSFSGKKAEQIKNTIRNSKTYYIAAGKKIKNRTRNFKTYYIASNGWGTVGRKFKKYVQK